MSVNEHFFGINGWLSFKQNCLEHLGHETVDHFDGHLAGVHVHLGKAIVLAMADQIGNIQNAAYLRLTAVQFQRQVFDLSGGVLGIL